METLINILVNELDRSRSCVWKIYHQGQQPNANQNSKKYKFNTNSTTEATSVHSPNLDVPNHSKQFYPPVSTTGLQSETSTNRTNASLQSPQPTSVNSKDKELTDKLLNQLKMLCQPIRKDIIKGTEHKLALHNAAMNLSYSLEYDVQSTSSAPSRNPQFMATLKVLGVLVAKSSCPSKKKAKSKAATEAVATLLNPLIHIASEGGSLVLRDGIDRSPVKSEPPASNFKAQQVPKNPPSAPINNSCAPVGNAVALPSAAKTEVFSLDPALRQHFLILDNTAIFKTQTAVSVIVESAQFCKIPHKFNVMPYKIARTSATFCCELYLGNSIICRAFGPKLEVKDQAARLTLDMLRKIVFTVKVKDDSSDGFTVPRSQMMNCPDTASILTESNIGCKMLKMMGWSGGGIGKEGNTGISEPIKADTVNQHGFGLGYADNAKNYKTFCSRIESLLHDYARSNASKDLIFSTEFSMEERKKIHTIANKYHLKNVSRGSGDNRYLVISRRFTPQELLAHLIDSGGFNGKYELIGPQA